MTFQRMAIAGALGALLLAAVCPAAPAQTTVKVGVFDPQRITQETAEGARIQARLTALSERKRSELEKLQAELKKQQDEFLASAVSLSEDKRKEMGLKIERLQIELEGKQKSASREVQMEAEQAQQNWQNQVIKVVGDFGAKNGFTLILPVDATVFHSPSIDITGELIKAIDTATASKPAEPAPPKPASPK